jgi:hypothetical protein
MKKPKADKRYGVTIAPLNGLPGYKWRVTFPEGGKRVQKYFKIKSGEGGALEFAKEKREELKQGAESMRAYPMMSGELLLSSASLWSSYPTAWTHHPCVMPSRSTEKP